MLNTGNEISIVQVLYNLIHWIIGLTLCAYAFLEYKHRKRKTGVKAPLVFSLAGGFFIVSTLLGCWLTFRQWYWPWQLSHEHTAHIITGTLLLAGGLLAALARKKILPKFAVYALPAAFALSALIVMQPHSHSTGGETYMTIYHTILGALVLIAAIFITASYMDRKDAQIPARVVLVICILPGLALLTYRHPQPISAAAHCHQNSTKTYAVDISKGYQVLDNLGLCDTVTLRTSDNESYMPAIGDHDRHLDYPGFASKIVNATHENTFIATQAGSYSIHDHLSGKELVELRISDRAENKTALSDIPTTREGR